MRGMAVEIGRVWIGRFEEYVGLWNCGDGRGHGGEAGMEE